jgi:hypothetical protein
MGFSTHVNTFTSSAYSASSAAHSVYKKTWWLTFCAPSHAEQITDGDKVFTVFCESCVASPSTCALARNNVTAADLEAKIYNLIDNIKFNPVPFNNTLIDYDLIKNGIAAALYGPLYWSGMAAGLDALITGNLTLFAVTWDALLTSAGGATLPLAGISCSDKPVRFSSVEELRPSVERQYSVSRILGGTYPFLDAVCSQWRMDAKERYLGDFQVRTRNPVLLVGNTGDPLTPLVSARNVSSGLAGSVVLQHNGYGVRHIHLIQPLTVSCLIFT